MVAIKLQNFGGMIPAVDDRLLPQAAASEAINTWVYSGAVEGIWSFRPVHDLVNPLTRKVFRIPFGSYAKDRIQDSVWLEFDEPDVDVLKSPVADDTFDRFYMCGNGVAPSYNTQARILNGDPPFVLGVPAPTVAPKVTREAGKYFLAAGGTEFVITSFSAEIFYSLGYALDSDSFGSGPVDTNTAPFAGQSFPISSLRGNLDQATTPPAVTVPANLFRILTQRSELRYSTVVSGNRITISDSGITTAGFPTLLAPADVSSAYEGQGVLEYRAYVYTWVTAYGEEGPPSPPGFHIGYSGDPWVIAIEAPGSPETTGRNLDKVRIYRTITGVEGSTSFFLVDELPLATLTFTDTEKTVTVAGNTQLESLFWSAPPTDLLGINLLPNGIMVGFRKNEIWFSEPYRPHAWPAPYVLTVEYPVVGIGTVGQTAIICTNNTTYAISGVNPSSMSTSKLPGLEPCLSRGSILNTPAGVAYSSPDGVAVATPATLDIVTRELLRASDWQDTINFLRPDTLRATSLGVAYYAWGSVRAGCFDPVAFGTDAFLQNDFTGAYRGAMIDLQNQRVAYTKLETEDPMINCFADPWSGETLVIRNGQVLLLDRGSPNTRESYIWRSKVIEAPNQRSFGAMRLYFSDYDFSPELNPVRNVAQDQQLSADQWGIVRVYADGRLVVVREMRQSGEIFKLPSGFKATFWEIEVEARVRLFSIEFATTAKELMSV